MERFQLLAYSFGVMCRRPGGAQGSTMCRLECTGGRISQALESSNYKDFGIRFLLLGAIITLEQDKFEGDY